MARQTRRTWMLLAGGIALCLGVTAPGGQAHAKDGKKSKKVEIPFDEASIFLELNDTDGDLGIHALIDGDPWKTLAIEDPRGREMLDLEVQGRLRKQGLTELFFESAEPNFDDLPPEDFLKRFPEGEYEIEGVTLEGDELESSAELSHVMPAPVDGIVHNRVDAAENCDVEPLPSLTPPVIIDWEPVTDSHPEIGKPGDVEVTKYQVVVERRGDLLVLSVDLPPDVTEFEIPEDFTDLGDEFKFEILVRAANGNQTAVESCFDLQ